MVPRLQPLVAFVGVAVVVAAGAAHRPSGAPGALVLTHGIASGDVTASTAVIWGRASGKAQMHVELASDPQFSSVKSSRGAEALEETDFTAKLTLDGLEADTRYWYRVWLAGPGGQGRSEVADSQVGTFKTAPAAGDSRPIGFIVGADLGGQQYCRNADQGGYTIFSSMEALAPEFFIANGDMIYADSDCPANGPDGPGGWQNIPGDFPSIVNVDWTDTAALRRAFLQHYHYNRQDPFYQSFLRSTATISQWDDHEVINDFGARWSYWNAASITREGYPNIVRAGLDTFFAYSPIQRHESDPDRIYRSFRYGQHLEVFVLDARSYRDRNDLPDTVENDKQMLGTEQLAWLVEGIRNSTATWKVVSSDVPMSIYTGPATGPRDAWANLNAEPTGFERELLHMLSELDRINAKNVVFVTTDVHFAETIAYDLDADGDGDRLVLHELVCGPLNAGRLPLKPLDPTTSPVSLYAESNVFNFGYVRIEPANESAHLIADVRGVDGLPRLGSVLHLTPQ